MTFLGRILSLGQHAVHAVAASRPVQQLAGILETAVKVAAKVVEAALPPVEVPEDYPKQPLDRQITDKDITERIARFQENIDHSIRSLDEAKRKIVDEIENAQREEAPRPVSTSTALTPLYAKEEKALEEIKKHIFHFAGICIFDQGVLGNKPTSTINFYKKYALNTNYKDATEAYLDDLYRQNRALFFIAKICIPIIHWFVGLFLTPGNETSIPYLYAKLKTYFSNPDNIKKFLLEELKIGQQYFADLDVHYENYCKEKHPDQYGERAKKAITDSPEDYMKKQLKGGEELLYERFNTRLFELLQVRTRGLHIIDAIANRILKHVIGKLSPAKMVLDSITTGTGAMDPTFGWTILDLVKRKIIEPAKAAIEKLNEKTTLPLHTRISQTTAVDKHFSQEDQLLVYRFVETFITYLPLELVTSSTDRASYHCCPNWLQLYKTSLVDGAAKMLLELAAEFVNNFEANESDRVKFRLQVYDFIEGALFKAPPLTYSDKDYADQKGKIKQALTELVNRGLQVSFKTEYFRAQREKEHLKVACSIATLNHDLTALREELQISPEAIQAEDLERIEKENLALLAKLRQGMTQISIDMQDFLAFKGKSQATESFTKNQMMKVLATCEAILQEHLEIQKQIEQLHSCILPVKNVMATLIQENKDQRINGFLADLQRKLDGDAFSKKTARRVKNCKKQSNAVCHLQREIQETKESIHQKKETLRKYEQALEYIKSFHNRPRNIQHAVEHLLELSNHLRSRHPGNFARFEQQFREDLALFRHEQGDVVAVREKLRAIHQRIAELAALERDHPAQLDLSLQSEVVRGKGTYRKRLLDMINAYNDLLGELVINDDQDQRAFQTLAPADLRNIEDPNNIDALSQRIVQCKKQLSQEISCNKIRLRSYALDYLSGSIIKLDASVQREFKKSWTNIHQANNRIKKHLQQMQKEIEGVRIQPFYSPLPSIVEQLMALWEKNRIDAEISALKGPMMRFFDRVSHVEQLALRSHAALAEIVK